MFPIEAFRETLTKAVQLFTAQQIPFHLTGGITSVTYGEPRMTQEFDLVADNVAVSNRLPQFIETLAKSDFLFVENDIRSAISSRQMFQLFDSVEALKLDIYPREMIPGELQRSVIIEVFEGIHLPVASRADAAVSKLMWVSKGSHKNRQDVRQIFRLAGASDQARIKQLSGQLGIAELLETVLTEADELNDT